MSTSLAGPGLDLPLRVLRACSEEDRGRAVSLRAAVFAERRGVLLDLKDDREVQRDTASFVFLACRAETPVATMRVTPLSTGLAETMQLAGTSDHLGDIAGTCEVGRLASAEEGGECTATMFLSAAEWVRDHTSLHTWVAYCLEPLVPIFGHFGARDMGLRYRLPDRPGVFAAIQGSVADVLNCRPEG